MTRSVWRPERRNRKIGFAGFGGPAPNEMRIPESLQDKHGVFSAYYERLEPADVRTATVGDRQVKLLYEEPREGFTYGCSPADVVTLFSLAVDLCPAFPEIVAFRQPTRKQRSLSPVWGRFIYEADFGAHCGSAIVLEAQEIGAPLNLSRRMTPEGRAEFDRLVADGHVFVEMKRRLEATLRAETIRNTILYRTLPHELGHLVHYHLDVRSPATTLADDEGVAADLFFSKPSSEREAFAHRFGDLVSRSLRQRGDIPFEPRDITT